MALYLDDRHRLVGTAILTIGWVQAARLSARPLLFGSQACQSSTCILVRYRCYGAPSATEGEERSFPVPSPQRAAGTASSWPIT